MTKQTEFILFNKLLQILPIFVAFLNLLLNEFGHYSTSLESVPLWTY